MRTASASRRGGWLFLVLAILALGWLARSVWAVDVPVDSPLADERVSRPLETSQLVAMWIIPLIGALAALTQAFFFFRQLMAADEGTPTMVEIAGHVREGANAYLNQQYRVVAGFFVVFFALLLAGALWLKVLSEWVPFALITSGFLSGLAGWFGMKTATWASSRTAAAAQKSLNQGLQVAFRSGAVMGLTVVGLGLLDITIWFAVLYWGVQIQNPIVLSVTMLSFGIGASSQALFARVGGGIFTKAADVGADLVGKVEKNIPEDDPRNPATIADNVGDNVGDVAGMGADLYESYYGAILASAALGVAAFASPLLTSGLELSVYQAQLRALFLPLTVAGVGILMSIVGIYAVRTDENATQKNLLKAIARGINLSTLLIVIAAFVLTAWLMPRAPGTVYDVFGLFEAPGVAFSIIIGLLAGWIIGKWTEYSTSDEFGPTKRLAAQSQTGPATIIIGGIAEGMISTWVPVITIGVAMLSAFGFANGWNFVAAPYFTLGLFGVGIAAVGMLSTLGITLATDAYGPIADNAGGNAEMSHLPPVVRQRTDALDSLGNTTAATGKGFAIGSAALTALALLAAYVEEVRVGFQRWEDDVAVSIKEPGFYKLSKQFVLHKGNDGHTEGLIAFRDDIQDQRVIDNWDAIDFSGGPAKIDAKSLGWLSDPAAETGSERLLLDSNGRTIPGFPASGARLVRISEATLLDFTRYYEITLMNPKVLVGVFLGAMSTFVFCALTMKAVGSAANGMVEEVRRQFREKPGILDGSEKPDYATPVSISTQAAQRQMILPALLGLATPVAVGMLLGVGGVMGLLVGALTTGFCVAVFMANSGGAWDNAKKYIESGQHGGKGTDAHKAAVVGDTVGDPFKDTSGPSLNILIKLMSIVSVVVAGLVVRYSLVALGIF